MARSTLSWGPVLLLAFAFLAFMPGQAAAFGAGNIPSIAQVEGVNWRHGGESSRLLALELFFFFTFFLLFFTFLTFM